MKSAPPKISAGLLMYRRTANGLELLCVHPGGPYLQHRDAGAWSIPKGVPEPDEALFRAACREFTEETGLSSTPPYLPLGEVRQKGGKVVHAWAFEGDTPPGWQPTSNTFELEWPPQSGRQQRFPEIDRAAWLDPDTARQKLNAAQAALVDRLDAMLSRANPADVG